ncbi:hypothetical protein [Halogranum rubrum]|uniref:hypothetical protein n=1 Tax=Halogranum rubrum TaxID=553466 RepID=UPI0011605420|nr:hypothetical protein [Halogranum rubrum]
MSSHSGIMRVDPLATLAAFGRVAYSELVTIVILSVLFTLVSLPVVTVGSALLALVRVLTDSVTGEVTGNPISERARAAAFLTATRQNVKRGLPLSGLLVVVGVVTTIYLSAASATRDAAFLLGSLAGLYALIIAVVWTLRAATLVVRAPEEQKPSTWGALRNAAYHLIETPSFTVLHLVCAAVVCLLCVAVQIGVVLLLPGLLALLEVTTFEETTGEGALRLVRAYRGELV